MDRQTYNEIMESYRLRREENWRREQERQNEVRQKHPDLAELLDKRHKMILSGVHGILNNAPTGDLADAMQTYNAQIATLLERYGYPKNYLYPLYNCEKCHDTGFVGEGVKTECECFRQAYALLLSAKNETAQESKTFENFDISRFPDTLIEGKEITQRRYMQVIFKRLKQYADDYPAQGPKDVLLHGSSGLGKTYLMFCVAHAVRQKSGEAVYVTAYQLLDEMRAAYFGRGGDTDIFFDAKLLLVDDLGMEPLFENITVEQIFNLLNERQMKGLGTVFSTNLSRVELQKRYTERFTSRLLDARTCLDIPFYGQDIRLMRE